MEKDIVYMAEKHLGIIPKEEQIRAIKSYMTHKDTILIAPTGYGKSLLFQLAPFLFDPERYSVCAKDISDTSTVSSSNSSSGSTSSDSWTFTTGPPAASTPTRITRPKLPIPDAEQLSTDFSGLSVNSIEPDQDLIKKQHGFSQFLIIMPLVALIKDAIIKIKVLIPNISAIHLTAATKNQAKHSVFVFTSPETIVDGDARKFVQANVNIKAIFIDEFHIVHQWGMDQGGTEAFRSAYGQLNILRALTKDVPFICMSATAHPAVIAAVQASLKLKEPTIINVTINKSNISYHTVGVSGSILKDFRWLVNLINGSQSSLPKVLLFFTNLTQLIDAFQYVTYYCKQPTGQESPTIVMYHMITDSDIKEQVINDLGNKQGLIKCVFCTSSLSMGINLSDIQYVIHYGAPNTAAAFLQETGRVAREYNQHGQSVLLKFPKMVTGHQLDSCMKQYIKGENCLRNTLLSQFQCTKPDDQLLCCDVCDPSLTCDVKDAIVDSFASSEADSFSDSLSIASLDGIEELDVYTLSD